MADMPGSGNGVNGSGDANNGKNISDEQLSEFMRGLFGDRGDDMIASMRERGMDPAHMLAQNGRLPDPATMQAALAQVKQMFAASGDDPVNTRLAHDLARQAAVKDGDPSIMAAQAKQAKDALSVAELWLDAATTLPPAGGQQYAWSRSEWVEATLPSWHRIVAPVASSMADALATVLGDGRVGGLELDIEIPADLLDNDPDDAASTDAAGSFAGGEVNLDQLGLGGLSPTDLIRKVGAAAFGMQVGQAAGTLSREVFGVTDVGLPLLDAPGTALLPSNVDGFADGLDIPADEVRL
ncbi:MAG: zinc-dependent metalloprotease, partial [Cellulomonadaceae bacterium]|nr:zinc-dependent metalloprotease [Cellulomonadaceae bacterium]